MLRLMWQFEFLYYTPRLIWYYRKMVQGWLRRTIYRERSIELEDWSLSKMFCKEVQSRASAGSQDGGVKRHSSTQKPN